MTKAQVIKWRKSIPLKDALTFLESLDLTPPPEKALSPSLLPTVIFDREKLMGVK